MSKEQLTEMKKFIRISEGAWALPRNPEDFRKLDALLKNEQLSNKEFQDQIYDVLGDDDLFDRLGKLTQTDVNGHAAAVTEQWMKDQVDDQYSNFPTIWQAYRQVMGLDDGTQEPVEELEELEEVNTDADDFMHEIELESVVEAVLGEPKELKKENVLLSQPKDYEEDDMETSEVPDTDIENRYGKDIEDSELGLRFD